MDRFQLQKLRDLPIEGVAEQLELQVTRHKCAVSVSRRSSCESVVQGEQEHVSLLRLRSLGRHDRFGDAYLRKDFLDATNGWRTLTIHHSCVPLAASVLRPSGPLTNMTLRKLSTPRDTIASSSGLGSLTRRDGSSSRSAGLDERVVRWCRLLRGKTNRASLGCRSPYYDPEGKVGGCAEPQS